jgi:hypothetical protein
VAVVNGLTLLYMLGGVVLVIATLVLLRSFGASRGRRWALSSIGLVVLAALIVTPTQLNASRNPVIAYAPGSDAHWASDRDGGGYVVTTRSIDRIDADDVTWERPALQTTWNTPDGVVTAREDDVRFITTSGDVAWEHTAYDLGGGDRVTPVAWNDGVTTVSVCDSGLDGDVIEVPACRFIGVDSHGAETYRIDAKLAATVYPGGRWSYGNSPSTGASGTLPNYFGYAEAEDSPTIVVDAGTGSSVTTVPVGDDISIPSFAADRVLTGMKPDEVCTVSRVPVAGDAGWTAEVPCQAFDDDDEPGAVYSRVSFSDAGLLDGDVIWWRPEHADDGDSTATGIDLKTGETASAGKVRWESLTKKDAADFALASNGLLIEARDGALTVRDPFPDSTSWSAPLQGSFHSAESSTGVLAVVTKPTRPRIFASEDDLDVTVYSLDDGRILGRQRFDPEHASHVLPLDDAALLVLDDGTSIRVGG